MDMYLSCEPELIGGCIGTAIIGAALSFVLEERLIVSIGLMGII